MTRGIDRRCPCASRLARRLSVARFDFRQWLGSGADSWLLLVLRDQNQGDTGLKGRHACVRQIFPFSSIRTLNVGFGIAPNLLTPSIARRALAGSGDRSPLPPVGTFTPPRERGRTEIRPM